MAEIANNFNEDEETRASKFNMATFVTYTNLRQKRLQWTRERRILFWTLYQWKKTVC